MLHVINNLIMFLSNSGQREVLVYRLQRGRSRLRVFNSRTSSFWPIFLQSMVLTQALAEGYLPWRHISNLSCCLEISKMESEIAFKVFLCQPCWLNPNCHKMLRDVWRRPTLIQNVVSCVLTRDKDVTYSTQRLVSVTLLRRRFRARARNGSGERSHRFSCCYLAHCVGLQQVRLFHRIKLHFNLLRVIYISNAPQVRSESKANVLGRVVKYYFKRL